MNLSGTPEYLNTLIKFTYLMASKLYLLMDGETFN